MRGWPLVYAFVVLVFVTVGAAAGLALLLHSEPEPVQFFPPAAVATAGAAATADATEDGPGQRASQARDANAAEDPETTEAAETSDADAAEDGAESEATGERVALISYGASLEEELDDPLERHRFHFDGVAGELIRVRVDGKNGMDPVTTLFGVSGAELASNDDESGANRDSMIVARLNAGGRFEIRVAAFDERSTGRFVVSLERLEAEPEAATEEEPLTPGGSANGTFTEPEDRDEFVIEATAGDEVVVEVDGEIGVDTFAEVYEPDGAFLVSDDDGGHGLDAEVRFVAAESGHYRLQVQPVAAKLGAYRVRVRVAELGSLAISEPDAQEVARDHWRALQLGDADRLFALAGPEAKALWGWESALDIARDLEKLRQIGIAGQPLRVDLEVDGDRARATLILIGDGGEPLGTTRLDLLLVEGQWQVEFAQRFGAAPYLRPLPNPSAAPPVLLAKVQPRKPQARAAIVIDADSGAVLYEHNAHVAIPPASLTKVVTGLLAIERGNLDEPVRVNVDSRLMNGSTVMGLIPGDRFTLRQLVFGLLLESGNDAALAIAQHLSGSEEAFVQEMNATVAAIGLFESHFTNPHGLSEGGQVASAYDLGMLARYALTLPAFADVVSTRERVVEGSRSLELENGNEFLDLYRGADGIKTGFTEDAGPTLIASASRDGHRVIVVLMNAGGRSGDAAALLDWAFGNHCWADNNSSLGCRSG